MLSPVMDAIATPEAGQPGGSAEPGEAGATWTCAGWRDSALAKLSAMADRADVESPAGGSGLSSRGTASPADAIAACETHGDTWSKLRVLWMKSSLHFSYPVLNFRCGSSWTSTKSGERLDGDGGEKALQPGHCGASDSVV